jgi:glucose-6-phosphate isomerase
MKRIKKPEIRHLKDLKGVLLDREWLESAKNFPVYYMHRGIKKMDELRYDMTVMPPNMLGKEFAKTKGNRNSKNFRELYTVLQGKAIFLMQKMKGRIIKDVMAVRAGKEAWVIVPPKYYVISINPSKNVLKLGNWVSEKNKNIYKDMEKMRGACYYYTKSGWIKNKNYEKVPKLKFKRPLKSMPENLDFLYGGN